MADRIKLRRGPKNNIDLNVYELGYATDSDEERLYFNNGSMVPIPNNKDITDIKTELTETTNVTNKNKQDVSELKESVAGIIKTGVAKLVQYSYDIELSENTKKVNIPYERYSSVTDTLKVYVNGLAIQNDQYTITDPVENDGIVTNGYIVLKVERPAGTIVRLEVWKNVPSGEEGEVNGNIITKNSLPLDRIIGINDIRNNPNLLINGDFQVWQRGTSFNLSKNDVKYTSDRWKIWCNNDTPITISRENGLKFDGANSNLYYHFEDSDFNKINNKIVTMSIMVDNNVYTETFIYNGNNSWTELFRNDKIQLAYNGTTKSIEVGLIKSVTIQWIKLELGSVATPFVSRPYGEELVLCKRYYQYNPSDSWFLFHRSRGGGLRCDIPAEPMRVKPTLLFPYETIDLFNTASQWESIQKSKCSVFHNFSSQVSLFINVDTPGLSENITYIAKNIPCFDAEIYN